MWDFDTSEFIFFGCSVLATVVWLIFLAGSLFSAPKIGSSASSLLSRFILALTPVGCCVFTYFVIQSFADRQVRGHADYITLFLFGQGLWLAVTCVALPLLGLSIAGDILERSNPAATIVAVAAMVATSIIYADSNIGSGPTIWTTIVPAAVGTIVLALLWILINSIGSSPIDDITIDRDIASAVRVAGALIACAVILARAAAGEWISWHETFISMAVIGWPAFVLAGAAGFAHRFLRPTPQAPRPHFILYGVVPAMIFLLFSILILVLNPHPFHPSQW